FAWKATASKTRRRRGLNTVRAEAWPRALGAALRPLSHPVVGCFLLSVVRILRVLRLGRLVGHVIIALCLMRFARRLAFAGGLVGIRLLCFTLFRLHVVSLLRRVHYWPCSA